MTEQQALDYAKEQKEKGFGADVMPGTSNYVLFSDELAEILKRNDEQLKAKGGSAVKLPEVYAKGGSIEANAGRGMAGLARSKENISPREVQAMFADVAGSAGIPFGYPTGMALRGDTEGAKRQAAIEAAFMVGLPAAAMAAKPISRAVKRAAPVTKELLHDAFNAAQEAGLIQGPAYAIKAYHGTPMRGLSDLSPRKAMEVRDSVWFSDNPNVADQYRYPREYGEVLYDEPAGDLLTANLLFENPMTVDMSGDVGEAIRLGRLLNEAKTKGFDALVLKNVDDTIDSSKELGTSFAVWNPELIQLIERNNKKIKTKDIGLPAALRDEALPAAERKANLEKFLEESAVKTPLYHATPQDFSVFKPGGDNTKLSGPAIWMSPSKEFQPAAHNIRKIPNEQNKMYGNESNKFSPGANVMPVHASIKNPLVTTEKTWKEDFQKFGGGSPWTLTQDEVDKIKDVHDGIMYYDKNGILSEVIAFEPTQIKSALGNVGSFNPKNPDITKAKGGSATKSVKKRFKNG